MDGRRPRHTTSLIPGLQNQGDEAGDGPPGRQPWHMTPVFPGSQNWGDKAGDGPSESLSADADPSGGLDFDAGPHWFENRRIYAQHIATQHATTQHNMSQHSTSSSKCA